MPETKLLQRMLKEAGLEIDYMNRCTVPTLLQKFGAGTFRTGMILRCAEMPTLIDAPKLPTGAVSLHYKDCVAFSGHKVFLDKDRLLARYYGTDEGKRYKSFLDGLSKEERPKYEIFLVFS